jgi:hypothetical protein
MTVLVVWRRGLSVSARSIREQFVKLYQDHDVLQEILDCAREDLEDPKVLADKPKYGDLDIEQVRDAQYAFA